MASIKASLKINETGNGVIESVTTNIETNNVSSIPYATDVTTWFLNQTTENKTYVGAYIKVLGSGAEYGDTKYGLRNVIKNKYTNRYLGLMFPSPNDLQSNLTLTIVGTDIISFNIYFDQVIAQYPTSYTIYSSISGTTTTYTNDNNVIEISDLLAGHGTTIITFTGWTYQDRPIGITHFENTELDIYMDKYWINSFETQAQKTTDAESIQFGILANTGSITLNDKRDTEGKPILLEYSKMGYLNMYLFRLDLYINDRMVQSHISNSAPYFMDNFTMKFELTNDVEKMKNGNINLNYSEGYTALEILQDILSDYGVQIVGTPMLLWTSNGNVEMVVGQYLSSIEIAYHELLIFSGNVLDVLNKFCSAFGLNAYFDDTGKRLIFSSFRPRKVSGEVAINIPYQKQYSDFDYSILTSNRYDRVFFGDEAGVTSYKNAIVLSENEFSKVWDTDLEEVLRESILEDYAEGIKIAKISVFPGDLYTTNGVIAKRWKFGEILEINDIVRVENKEGNNVIYDKNYQEVYWRIVDRKVKYEGQIIIDLVLQEIKN